MVGSFRAQNFQKSRKFHELPRKWFHFKPLTPTHPGGAVLGDTWREGGKEEEGRSKGAGREEGERGREGGEEAGGRTKVGVREQEGRKLGGGREGGDVGGSRDEEEREGWRV